MPAPAKRRSRSSTPVSVRKRISSVKDNSNDDDTKKSTPSPPPSSSLKPTVSSSSSSSLKSKVSLSKATQRYSLLNIIVILILIVITSTTTLVMIKGYQYIITLENKISTFADQMEDANFLNKALQEEVSDMAKEKSLYVKTIDQYRSELNRIEKKFSACVNELKGDLSKADKNQFDNDMDSDSN